MSRDRKLVIFVQYRAGDDGRVHWLEAKVSRERYRSGCIGTGYRGERLSTQPAAFLSRTALRRVNDCARWWLLEGDTAGLRALRKTPDWLFGGHSRGARNDRGVELVCFGGADGRGVQ